MRLRSAWLYTRDNESVRIELRDEETRFLVVVQGPGNEWTHQICADHVEALQAQLMREADLVARGFILEGFEQWQPARRAAQPASARASGGQTAPAELADPGLRRSR